MKRHSLFLKKSFWHHKEQFWKSNILYFYYLNHQVAQLCITQYKNLMLKVGFELDKGEEIIIIIFDPLHLPHLARPW